MSEDITKKEEVQPTDSKKTESTSPTKAVKRKKGKRQVHKGERRASAEKGK